MDCFISSSATSQALADTHSLLLLGLAHPDATHSTFWYDIRLAACRAYKLGKKRWSYNQCELKIVQEGGDQRLDVVEAVQVSTLLISGSLKTLLSHPCPCSCTNTCSSCTIKLGFCLCAGVKAMLLEKRHLKFPVRNWQD